MCALLHIKQQRESVSDEGLGAFDAKLEPIPAVPVKKKTENMASQGHIFLIRSAAGRMFAHLFTFPKRKLRWNYCGTS